VIRRGEIYFVDLNPVKGKEQAGYRPVLVVSDNLINAQPLVASVVMGTDARNVQKDYPTNVRVTAKESGLPKDTIFLCFQLRSLDPTRFGKPLGLLLPDRMKEIDQALKLVLGLHD